jgi:hypothetical protein
VSIENLENNKIGLSLIWHCLNIDIYLLVRDLCFELHITYECIMEMIRKSIK